MVPTLDLYKNPFTEETITKLEIFEKYFEAWLPVFIHHPVYDEANVCDFFAGRGEDKYGNPGSPLRILEILKTFQDSIVKKKFRIKLLLNELDTKKFRHLKTLVEGKQKQLDVLKNYLSIEYQRLDFKELFEQKKTKLKNSANLLFLDQNGIKQVSEKIFLELESFSITDFIFFISSSFFKRFNKEFKNIFPHLDCNSINDANYFDIHQIILEEYKKLLPSNSKTVLYPFSIKKGANIYGLIFGTKHPLAVDKFLHIAWDKNRLNGSANFDIGEDLKKQQRNLFENKLTKIEKFQFNLKEMILSSKTINNKDVYDFTIENGHIPKHSIKVVKNLKEKGKIFYSGHPHINYNSCYKNIQIIEYKLS